MTAKARKDMNAVEVRMYRQFRELGGIEKRAPSRAPQFAGDTPKCFTREQYAFWKVSAREASPGPLGPCVDCTPANQRQMLREERCERPGIKFRVDADGLLEGYYPRDVGALNK